MFSRRALQRATRLLPRAPTAPAAPAIQLPPSLRSFSTSSTTPASYRRFGDPPRSTPRLPGGNSSSKGSSGLPSPVALFTRGRGFQRPPAFIFLILGAGGAYYIFHLERVEQTGRWRFMDVSQSTERAMGEQSFQEVMAQYRGQILSDRHPTAQHVQEIVKRLVRANGLETGSNDGWKTYVVEDNETRNAFVLPGGKIFVFTGIIPVAQDSDGLAVILGHEIAHQVARHSAERMSSVKVLMGLSLLLESLGLDVGLSRILLNLFMTLPNSRKAETEADYIGLSLATAACYDPRAATGLWQRMDSNDSGEQVVKKGGVNVDFLSTHPTSSKRVEKVTEWAKEIIKDRPYSCGPLREQTDPFRRASGARW